MSTPEKKTKTPVDAELSAMRRIISILNDLDPAARRRVVNYAAERVTPYPTHSAADVATALQSRDAA